MTPKRTATLAKREISTARRGAPPLEPRGGGWSNLWSLSAQDRWSCFIR
jgi:hypothetical protein